jgi:hypothetical protein
LKLTRDEKIFLDRVSFRLFNNPLKWRQLVSDGMSHDEIFQYFVSLTKQKAKEKAHVKDTTSVPEDNVQE